MMKIMNRNAQSSGAGLNCCIAKLKGRPEKNFSNSVPMKPGDACEFLLIPTSFFNERRNFVLDSGGVIFAVHKGIINEME
jgi:hypothetical protein